MKAKEGQIRVILWVIVFNFMKEMAKKSKLRIVKELPTEEDENVVIVNGKKYRKISYNDWSQAVSREQSKYEIERYKVPLIKSSWEISEE